MRYLLIATSIAIYVMSVAVSASEKTLKGQGHPVAAPRGSTREQRRLDRESMRRLKEVERAPIFNQQTPNQQEFYNEFMLSWEKYLQEMHPNYVKYLPARRKQVAEIYAQYTDYQLQLAQLEEEQRRITRKKKEIEKAIKWLEDDNAKIRRLEDERMLLGMPIDTSEL